MGRFRKYVKKQGKRLGAYAKKRYAPAGKVDFSKIASDVLKLKGIINSELKHKDSVMPSTAIPIGNAVVPWALQSLNGLTAQDGADPGEREGMSVRFKSLQILGKVRTTATAADALRIKMVIFVDKQPLVSGLSTDPVIGELFTNTGSVHWVNSLRSWDSIQQKRFTILHTKYFVLDDDKPEINFKVYKKLDMVTQWANGYTGADAQVRNKLYIAFFNDTNIGGEPMGAFEYQSRLTYRDN